MAELTNVERARRYYTLAQPFLLELARALVDDADAAYEEGLAIFDEMIPELAYLDRPKAPMADSLFGCSAMLALYKALRGRGVDAHAFGRTVLDVERRMPVPERSHPDDWFETFRDAGEESKEARRKGEFVFEVTGDRPEDGAWEMNILSCAICHEFSKHDAMDLVPYMCATDDVLSDQIGQGLRRTGTIALGAHHCDFHYERGGEPLRVAEQYPDKIRLA